ncbi:MAG: translation initiation factor IF-2 [Bacteroidetes bacterium]|nr:translation initiation factor IF-2 [Bacteroidota bacterium]
MPEPKAKKEKVISLVKKINISKEDLIGFLGTIGVEASINTSLEPDTVAKVYAKFRKEVEKEEQRVNKTVSFEEKFHVGISEAKEKMEKDEEDKRLKEEEERIRKNIEEELRQKEAERQRQELKAHLEREKAIEEAKERKKREKEEKKSKAESTEPVEKQPVVTEAPVKDKNLFKEKEEKPAEETAIPVSSVLKDKFKLDKPITEILKTTEKKHEEKPKPPFEKKPFDKSKPPFERKPFDKNKPPFERKPFDKNKPPFERKPFDKNRPPFDRNRTGAPGAGPNKDNKFQKVSISDLKDKRKNFSKPADGAPAKPGDASLTRKVFTPRTDGGISKPKFEDEKRKRDKERDKKKFEAEQERKRKLRLEKGHRAKDISQKEIDEAIRDTFAKIGEDAGPSSRSVARKRKKKEREIEEKKIQEHAEANKNVIKVTEFISTAELANLMNLEVNELIKASFKLGMMVSINQRLEKDLILLLAEDFGYKIEFQSEYEEEVLEEVQDTPESLKPRSPVVTIMGHVDHGKTSLLDYIRKANVVAGEAGGITQHIGAYKVTLESGKEIAFLDTPGHEAFTAMRARGGQAADIVVLVVAADDSVMPQTVEAINHALAANVPIVIAINKVDKPESNPDRIKQQLADKNILVEDWGGKYQSVEISAKHGQNVDKLLEKILLEAELLDLKANPDRNARAVVLEAKLDKGKGPVATVLVQKGTLKVGDIFIAGVFSGKVKAMFDERERKLEFAGPSTPAQVLGFDGVPQAGDVFAVLDTEREAKEISTKRQQLKREQDFRQVKFITLDDISKQISEGKQVELKIILKADFDGSAEAIADSLQKLTTSEAKVTVIHKAIGQISESDVLLAEASSAIIIGFNVRPNLNARKLAEKSSVDIRLYNIIYQAIEEVKMALEGLLEPEKSEEVTCTVEVRDVFKVPKVGNIAGCFVQDGKITRNTKIRLLREGLVIFDGNIASLKRIKDDVREVDAGYECGIGLENFNDIKVGDVIEGYKIVETKRKLTTA